MKITVIKLLSDAGQACPDNQVQTLRGLCRRRIRCDEIWAFVYATLTNVECA